MIVAGVVFMMIMEGFGLFSRYADRKVANIVAGSQTYEGYHRLALMIHNADSAAMIFDDRLLLFAEDKLTADMTVRDSLLIIFRNDGQDTILTNVGSVQLLNSGPSAAPDTVKLMLSVSGDEQLTLAFPIYKPVTRTAVKQSEDNERDYKYERNEKHNDKR